MPVPIILTRTFPLEKTSITYKNLEKLIGIIAVFYEEKQVRLWSENGNIT